MQFHILHWLLAMSSNGLTRLHPPMDHVGVEERSVEPEEDREWKRKPRNLHTSTSSNPLSPFPLKSLEVRRRMEGLDEGIFLKASVTDSVKSP